MNPNKELEAQIHEFACQPITQAYNYGIDKSDKFDPDFIDDYEERLLTFIKERDRAKRQQLLAAVEKSSIMPSS